jgi:hypothetical protein
MKRVLDYLHMSEWLLCGLLLLAVIAVVAPAQIAVVLYKAALVTCFAHLAYWIARRLQFDDELPQAIVVAAVILAGALAL